MKIIHQIYITDNLDSPPKIILDRINNLKNIYNDYEYIAWNDHSIKKFLKENFSQNVVEAYDYLKPYAFKADLARYCILYVLGGYYFDIAVCVDKKVEFNFECVLFKNRFEEYLDVIENDMMFFKNPKHDLLKKLIDSIVQNVKELEYGHHPLCVSGPLLLHNIFYKDNSFKVKLGKIVTVDGRQAGIIDENICYFRKDLKFSANLRSMGCEGTNNYEQMWFDGNVYKLKLSYVMITNNKKSKITKSSVRSLLDILTHDDELIIVGDVNFLKEIQQSTDKNVILCHDMNLATGGKVSHSRNKGIEISNGNIIVHVDDDILFPQNFQNNIIKYIKYNMPRGSFDTFNTKFVLINGARWWDRCVYFEKENKTLMVPYESNHDNLIYPAALLIWKKSIAEKIKWDENHLYYDPEKIHEDVKLSYDLKEAGYKIKIDINTYAVHVDDSYCVVKTKENNMIGIKRKDKLTEHIEVKDQTYHSEIKNLLKKYYII
jgi:hypothetical protein